MDNYVAFRSDPSNDHVTDGMWCGTNNFSPTDLKTWKLSHSKEMFSILEKRRACYADELIKVDQALFEKAKEGDSKAIALAWARYEGWSPKIEEDANKQGLGKNRTLADLIGEMD